MDRLRLAIDQIIFARNYTLKLLDQTPMTEWFRLPPGGVSHIAWQVGHLAFAEFRMAVWRIRGSQPQDDALIGSDFLRQFGAKSVPDADASTYPAAAAIRATLDRVHELALQVLPGLADAELDQAVTQPHPFAHTKLLALLWCAQHEMLHAGQIGLLRRQLGFPPLW